jgi:hypothetical protein
LNRVETFSDGKLDPADAAVILETDNPERAFFELGNAEEYRRIMDLEPGKRRNELVKLSLKAAPKPAPAEAAPKKASAPADPDAAWYAKRKAEKAAKYEREKAAGKRY